MPDENASTEARSKTDEELVRECVTAWLSEQEAARSGAEFWDDYARTLITEPDLSPFAEAMRSADQLLARHDAEMGRRPRRIRATIVEQQNLFAVRSWKLLDLKLTKYDEDLRIRTRRDAEAVVKTRIDSSDVDGSPITKVWAIGLFKNGVRWGISSLSSPSSE
ncbi:MAG: hypothetical protein ACRD4O_17140 [Bryobacteraceae bacterium]